VVERVLKGMGIPEEAVPAQSRKIIKSNAEQLSQHVKKQKKPFIGYSFHRPDATLMREVIANGMPVLQGAERAARAVAALVAYAGVRERKK